MVGEAIMFYCEPDVPYEGQEPWVVEIVDIHSSGKGAIGSVNPAIKAPFGELEGQDVSQFVFTPRHVGGKIDQAFSDFVVVYFHPYRNDETPTLENLDTEIPSRGLRGSLGYCVLSNRNTAKNKFKLDLGVA